MVGIFDRSHYEDVLIARVRNLAPAAELDRRYGAINDFEHRLVTTSSTTVIKCFLHISRDTQRERLLARLDDPTKLWKFNPADVDERAHWPEYQRAYEIALERCSTDAAPWYVVPSDRKWYRNWAITTLLTEQLGTLDPQWPQPDFDIAEQTRPRPRLLSVHRSPVVGHPSLVSAIRAWCRSGRSEPGDRSSEPGDPARVLLSECGPIGTAQRRRRPAESRVDVRFVQSEVTSQTGEICRFFDSNHLQISPVCQVGRIQLGVAWSDRDELQGAHGVAGHDQPAEGLVLAQRSRRRRTPQPRRPARRPGPRVART